MKRALRFAARCALLWLVVHAAACSQAAPRSASPSEWLAQVRAAHVRADAALAAGDLAQAQALLTQALEAPPPAEVLPEDARVVHQDLEFRLGELALQRGAPDACLLRAERGLRLGRGDDLFTANLLVVRGRALAALGRDIEAASSYQDALGINARLLRAALAAPDAPPPP